MKYTIKIEILLQLYFSLLVRISINGKGGGDDKRSLPSILIWKKEQIACGHKSYPCKSLLSVLSNFHNHLVAILYLSCFYCGGVVVPTKFSNSYQWFTLRPLWIFLTNENFYPLCSSLLNQSWLLIICTKFVCMD